MGILYTEGPSAIDGAPIVVIATGFASKTDNRKTGDMIQTWIIRRDVSPSIAAKDGRDVSICGDCSLRFNPETGERPCYVKVWQAPRSVYEAYQRGIYPRLETQAAIAEACKGRALALTATHTRRRIGCGKPWQARRLHGQATAINGASLAAIGRAS